MLVDYQRRMRVGNVLLLIGVAAVLIIEAIRLIG